MGDHINFEVYLRPMRNHEEFVIFKCWDRPQISN